jgi:ribonuclease HII
VGRAPGRAPRLLVETALAEEGYLVVAGADEVGRGCLAGPVTVGVVVVDPSSGRPPRGLRDSKLLSAEQRRALVPRIRTWVLAGSVADATAAEIDTYGIIAALRLAAHRALAALPDLPDCVLLDGNHDYLTPRAQLTLDLVPARPEPEPVGLARHPAVRTRIKADVTCASVAAASVLAKATRDAFMVELAAEHPGYGWDVNKGYATPYHRAALRRLGPSPYHRVSWRLGLDDGSLDDEVPAEEVMDGDGLPEEELASEADVDLTDGQDGVVTVRTGEGEVVR